MSIEDLSTTQDPLAEVKSAVASEPPDMRQTILNAVGAAADCTPIRSSDVGEAYTYSKTESGLLAASAALHHLLVGNNEARPEHDLSAYLDAERHKRKGTARAEFLKLLTEVRSFDGKLLEDYGRTDDATPGGARLDVDKQAALYDATDGHPALRLLPPIRRGNDRDRTTLVPANNVLRFIILASGGR